MIFFIKFIGIICFIFSSCFYTKHSSAENQINSNKLLLDSSILEDRETLNPKTNFENKKISDQKTALYYALSSFKIDTAVELVLAGADVNERGKFNKTLLHLVLNEENLELAKTLIERGADVNTRSPSNNETALHLAVKKGSLNDIEYLLNKGIDMGIRNKFNGKTAFHLAIQKENLKAIKLMLKKEEPLYQMALLDPRDYISYYRFTALHKRDFYSRTALDLTNNNQILDLLISAGAPIDAEDNDKKSLLERAWKAKNLEKVKFLAKRGAELNKRDEKDNTLLHYTFKEEDWEEKANFLIEIGADVNSQGENKRTLIYYILKRGNLNELKFLLDKGANPNIQDDLGQTPLHYAVKKGWINKVKLLVKNGADLTIKDNKGKTAIDLTNWTYMKDYLKKQQLSSCKDIFIKSVDST